SALIIFSYSNAEEEKRKREEAERKAKLDAIAAKQRQREIELEEKEKARKEQLLRGSEATRVTDSAPVAQPPREPAAPAVAVAATIAPAAGKYVPKFKRGDSSSSSAGGSQRPADVRTRDEDRWGSREERPRPDVRPLRQDGPPARQDAPPARPDGPPPATDRWRGSRFSSSSSTSSSTWGGRGTDAHRLRFFLLSGTSVQNVCQRSQGTWLLEFVFFIALTAPKILELVC
ncbi:eukaryotic translation initiation factor 3 subunit A-like, partial [Panicum hallii]|uniref:eukaryotic translation initiation factor 3 subunit A-like n=1 Tax=Panicum hallii TaxID=206008 RepID=UPI000DF4D629